MKQRTVCALYSSVLLATVFQAVAKDAPALPKVLRIYREELKQGKDAAHEKIEAAFAKMLAKNKYPAYSLGCTVLAGPTEAWFFESHDSMMSMEKILGLFDKNPALRTDFATLDGLDAEMRSNSSTMIAMLRDDLSYRAGDFARDLPKTRYFSMTIIRVRPFADAQFAELGKKVIEADQQANVGVPNATYEVVSGGPSGMYLLFTPMKSLETLDGMPARSRAMRAAMGMENAAELYKNAGEVITGSQMLLLSVNPRMSYVSKEVSAADPVFWMPKVNASPAKPSAPKAVEKSGAGQ